jgi:MYXO-CTERM domain-containing protein
MRSPTRPAWLALLPLLMAPPRAADASIIRYDYTGVVTEAGSATGLEPGDAFSGSFTIDPGTATPGLGIEGTASYTLVGDSSLDLPTGVLGTTAGGMQVRVTDYASAGQWSDTDVPSTRVSISTLADGHGDTATLTFANPDRSVFQGSLALPTLLQLSDFPSATLEFADASLSGDPRDPLYRFSGTIRGLTATPVPEPPMAVPVLLVAAAGLAARRRRRARLDADGEAC